MTPVWALRSAPCKDGIPGFSPGLRLTSIFRTSFLGKSWWLLFWGTMFFLNGFCNSSPGLWKIFFSFSNHPRVAKNPRTLLKQKRCLKVFPSQRKSTLTLGYWRCEPQSDPQQFEFWAIYYKFLNLNGFGHFGVPDSVTVRLAFELLGWPPLRWLHQLPRSEWLHQQSWGFMRSSFKTRTSSRRRLGFFARKKKTPQNAPKGCNLYMVSLVCCQSSSG